MPQTPRLWCADCGGVMHWQPASLPQGAAKCRPCRALARGGVVGDRSRAARSTPKRTFWCACDICGATFAATREGRRYCSRSCYGKRKRDGQRPARPCLSCGAEFAPSCTGHHYCSRICSMPTKASPVLWRMCPAKEHWHTTKGGCRCGCTVYPSCRVFVTECRTCSRWFCTPYTSSTCSESCAQIKSRLDRQRTKDRYRANKRNAYVADVVRADIYARDKYRCMLCRKKLNMAVVVPHPMAAVLDHVVPLARGGTHEPANVQAAHFLCNSVKADRGGGEQLALIG